MAREFQITHVAPTPRGWKVRTVIAGEHRVRVAFPPGRREKGSGVPVEVLHPRSENPICCKNPAELVLLGGNPHGVAASAARAVGRALRMGMRLPNRQPKTIYFIQWEKGGCSQSFTKKSAAERFLRRFNGAGRIMIYTPGMSMQPCRNPVPTIETEQARELASEFKHAESERYFVANEPHVPAGDYARLGDFIGIAVKPARGGQVQELSFPGSEVVLISDAGGRQLYIIGPQNMREDEIEIFNDRANVSRQGQLGANGRDEVLLGEARGIAYRATKWHPQVDDAHRGKNLTYEHLFGEEGGRKPEVFYSLSMHRLLIRGGDYTVEGLGIKN